MLKTRKAQLGLALVVVILGGGGLLVWLFLKGKSVYQVTYGNTVTFRSPERDFAREFLKSIESNNSIDLQGNPDFPTLEMVFRYYYREPWNLNEIVNSLYAEKSLSLFGEKSQSGRVSDTLAAKYVILPELFQFVSQANNYTDGVLIGSVIPIFREYSEFLRTKEFLDKFLEEAFRGMNPQCVIPFWLISKSTTADEFRGFCSPSPEEKPKLINEVRQKVETYLNGQGKSVFRKVLESQISQVA